MIELIGGAGYVNQKKVFTTNYREKYFLQTMKILFTSCVIFLPVVSFSSFHWNIGHCFLSLHAAHAKYFLEGLSLKTFSNNMVGPEKKKAGF